MTKYAYILVSFWFKLLYEQMANNCVSAFISDHWLSIGSEASSTYGMIYPAKSLERKMSQFNPVLGIV